MITAAAAVVTVLVAQIQLGDWSHITAPSGSAINVRVINPQLITSRDGTDLAVHADRDLTLDAKRIIVPEGSVFCFGNLCWDAPMHPSLSARITGIGSSNIVHDLAECRAEAVGLRDQLGVRLIWLVPLWLVAGAAFMLTLMRVDKIAGAMRRSELPWRRIAKYGLAGLSPFAGVLAGRFAVAFCAAIAQVDTPAEVRLGGCIAGGVFVLLVWLFRFIFAYETR